MNYQRKKLKYKFRKIILDEERGLIDTLKHH